MKLEMNKVRINNKDHLKKCVIGWGVLRRKLGTTFFFVAEQKSVSEFRSTFFFFHSKLF